MKNLLTALLLITLFAGCKKEETTVIQGSDIFTTQQTASSWIAITIPGTNETGYYNDYYIPEIDQDILDKGAVFVYEEDKKNNTAYETILPFTSDNGVVYRFEVLVGKVQIQIVNATSLPGAKTFKFVILRDK